MKLLHRYLRREIALHAALGLLLFTFVIFMQELGKALELAVRADSWAILAIFADALPQALVFTLPMAVLVGLLIGLGRLGVDNELVALSACGVSGRRLLRPLLEVTAAALGLSLAITLWLAPAAGRNLEALTAQLAGSQLAGEVQPRVFFEPENNPNLVLYTGGTVGEVWRQVLVADMNDPNKISLVMAAQGELVKGQPGAERNQIQLHLQQGASYTIGAGGGGDATQPDNSQINAFNSLDIPFALPSAASGSPAVSVLRLGALWQRARFGADWRTARVEFYKRFAQAFACLALALLGIPLGLRGGRGGKSGGFVLTLILVFAYYLLFILGLGLARQGTLPPWLGVWGADLIFFGCGAAALSRLDHLPRQLVEGADPVAWVRAWLSRQRKSARLRARLVSSGGRGDRSWMPSLLEGYVIREFLGYTGLLLASFLVIVLVSTLFELIGSILQNHISLGMVLEYLLYLTPQMFYTMIPVAILVGVLVTFGLMSKANEITALKASGVSAYRLLVPVLFAAFIFCAVQFTLDATWLPAFNQKQDALHAQIKGQPAQTYHNPEHKWVFGQDNDIYYFSFFDPGLRTFADVSVFEFEPQSFQLTRRIFAKQARWDDQIHGWVFTNGWVRDLNHNTEQRYQRFLVASFPHLPETPAYFSTDTRQGTQMTYGQLRRYIRALRDSGYDVGRLSVTLAKKVAYPLITVVMALLAFPFALSVGRRGTVAGITVGIVVAISYWSAAGLLEALGNLNQLPALVAAWTPDVLFFGASLYLLLRVPT